MERTPIPRLASDLGQTEGECSPLHVSSMQVLPTDLYLLTGYFHWMPWVSPLIIWDYKPNYSAIS